MSKIIVLLVAALCVVPRTVSAEPDPQTKVDEVVVRWETATASQPGYEEASMRLEYNFSVCSGAAYLVYRLKPGVEVGEWYRFDGERHLVSNEPAPQNVTTITFAGTIKRSGRAIKSFHDGTPYSRGGLGCRMGQVVRIGSITDALGNAADKDDIERYLESLSISVDRAPAVLQNGDLEDRLRGKKKAIQDEEDRKKKAEADRQKKLDDERKKLEDERKAVEAEIARKERERIEKTERDRANSTPSDEKPATPPTPTEEANDSPSSTDTAPANTTTQTTTTTQPTTTSSSSSTSSSSDSSASSTKSYEPARRTQKAVARDLSTREQELVEWFNDNTAATEISGYDCGYWNFVRLSKCNAATYKVIVDELGISTFGYHGGTIAWADVVGINITDMARLRVSWGPSSSVEQGNFHIVYITPKSGVDIDHYASVLDQLTGSTKYVLNSTPTRDYDGHEDEGEDRKPQVTGPMTPEEQFGVVAGAAAIAVMDALDRAKIWPQHAITVTRDGFGSSGDEATGMPAPAMTMVAMSYCRVWAGQIGLGYATTGKSASTVTDNDYKTAGTLEFYDKGTFLSGGIGACVPNRWVQPYILASGDLPLGGDRVQVGQQWDLTDGDVSGFRTRATAGVNFRFGKLPIGIGIRGSYTHVSPSVTLVDDPAKTGSTFGAEGGGASYWSLGLQAVFYPFRAYDPE